MKLEYSNVKKTAGKLKFRTQAFIDGKFVGARSGKTFTTENPATGKPLAEIAAGDVPEVDRAVRAARKAFDRGVWSRAKPAERKQVLLRFADRLEANADELALLDTLEAGKPIGDCATMDIPDTIHCIRWHAEATDKLYGHVSPTGPDNLALILREPVGVVGCVIPWNFPAQMAAWKIGPALATGNSVVLKPAELTSLSAIRMAELAAEAGCPPGVFNVVPGLGETAGQAIGRHGDVDMVAFTGSTEVGRCFLKYAAESNLKRVILECGGKSPQVVFADAPDLEAVANHAVGAAFWNMGENCSCGSRLIVHKNIKDELVPRRVVKLAKTWPVGDPLDPRNRLGAMIEKPHLEKVLGYIAAGRSEGAKLILGGRRILEQTGGYFVEVTIFDEVSSDEDRARGDLWPGVVGDSVLDRGRSHRPGERTNYGLAASLYTQDLNRAHRVSRAIRAGTVSVNCFSEGDITTPFGGFKQSGFFGRDKSIWAHDQYTELKTIWMQLA
jgi:4-(gamma-glutamylamino)butanal dehydrogenase